MLPITRYTRFVLLGKNTLWLLALTLTIGLFVVAWINRGDEGGRIVLSGDKGKDAGSPPEAPEAPAMVRPRYQGIDSRNRPFNVIADRAVQLDADTVRLEAMNADLTMEDTTWLSLKADTALYFIPRKMLELEGNIHLFYEDGYEFRTEKATLDINAGEASGNVPVEGQGPSGTLQADRFTIEERGAILHFMGNVKVTLYL